MVMRPGEADPGVALVPLDSPASGEGTGVVLTDVSGVGRDTV